METRFEKIISDWRFERNAEAREQAHLRKLYALLQTIRDELEDHFDTVDGPEGRPLPNWAMSLANEIDEVTGGR